MVSIINKTISNIDCLFSEGSASKGDNVEEIFSKLSNTIIYKVD